MPSRPKLREIVAALQLLRRHGQETCRRSAPRCKLCPLAKGCDFARKR